MLILAICNWIYDKIETYKININFINLFINFIIFFYILWINLFIIVGVSNYIFKILKFYLSFSSASLLIFCIVGVLSITIFNITRVTVTKYINELPDLFVM